MRANLRLGPGILIMGILATIWTVSAEAETVTLIKNIDNYDYHSDVWGYTSPGGVELAIVGTFNGTSFVDATDAANATEIAFIPGPGSGWRDIKTYLSYAYIVNESSDGLQIVNLTDPLNPQETATSPYLGAFSTCHNIYIDTDTALLYAVGTNNGTQVLDISNPPNPVLVGTFDDYYVHDIFVKNGIGYAGAIYDGFVSTIDVSDSANLTTLDTEPTPSLACHNAWTTEDGNYCLTSDETTSGHLGVFDVSDPNNITYVTEWENPDEPSSSIHNVLVNGDYAFISWYTAGLEILDVTVPGNPQRVGNYDTYPGTGGFDGAWGVYPFAESGLVYVSDISTGLYIFEFLPNFGFLEGVVTDFNTGDAVEGALVSIPSAGKEVLTDGTGYYRIILDAGNYDVLYEAFGYESEMINLNVDQGSATEQDVSLMPVPTGSLAGTVTEQGSGDPIEGVAVTLLDTPLSTLTGPDGSYVLPSVPAGSFTAKAEIFGYVPKTASVTIQENQETVRDFQLTAACIADDIESDAGWTVGDLDDDATTGIWVRVDPIGTGGGAVQPEDDHTTDPGVLCWVTGQGPPDGDIGTEDVDGGKTTLFSPFYNLSGAMDPVLIYHRWYTNDAGSNPGTDVFLADVSSDGGANWINLETLGETRNFWERMEFNLSDVIDLTDQVQLRFTASDEGGGSIIEAGIDDLEIFCGGTSTSAPEGSSVFVTRLFPAAPNPASGPVALRFQLARRQPVQLDVVDLQGRLVRRLAGGTLEPGAHEILWDGRNDSGRRVAGGIYLQRLVTPGAAQSRKIVITE